MTDAMIHHLASRADWDARDPVWYRPATLDEDGFVHCSFSEQVVATADRHLAGRRDLVLLTIDPARCTSPVVVEDTSGNGAFPHVHGPVDVHAIVHVTPFPPDADGGFGWWTPDVAGLVAHRRTAWTDAVSTLLDHFEQVGFDGAPRAVDPGDGGHWFTTWLPGDTVRYPAPAWLPTPRALGSLGRLLRRAHDASRDLDTRGLAFADASATGPVVTHHDVGPGNVVWRDGLALGLIDWEFAEPGDPVADLVDAALHVAGWVPRPRRRRAGYPDDPTPERLVDALLDGYGSDLDHAALSDAVVAHLDTEIARIRDRGRRDGQQPWARLADAEVDERLGPLRDWHAGGRRSVQDGRGGCR